MRTTRPQAETVGIGLNGQAPLTTVCRNNWKKALWNRHERASDCIWIPQCRLTLRSGAAAPRSKFQMIQHSGVWKMGVPVATHHLIATLTFGGEKPGI